MTNMNPVKYKLKHSAVFVRKGHGLDQLPTPLIIRIIIPPQSSSFFTIIIILVVFILFTPAGTARIHIGEPVVHTSLHWAFFIKSVTRD